jgi:hypothetical protein
LATGEQKLGDRNILARTVFKNPAPEWRRIANTAGIGHIIHKGIRVSACRCPTGDLARTRDLRLVKATD